MKDSSRAQLRREIKRQRAKIVDLQAKVTAFETPDPLRAHGERWYELVEYFDAKLIQRLPLREGRGFIMGRLDRFSVVEVDEKADVERVGAWLMDHDIRALIVKEGIRFLKISTVTPATEAKLDAAELAAEKPDAEKDHSPLGT